MIPRCGFTGLPIEMCAHCVKRFTDEIETSAHGYRPDKPIFASIGTSSHRMRDAAQATRNARWKHNTLTLASSAASVRMLCGMVLGKLDEQEKKDDLKAHPKTLPRKSQLNPKI